MTCNWRSKKTEKCIVVIVVVTVLCIEVILYISTTGNVFFLRSGIGTQMTNMNLDKNVNSPVPVFSHVIFIKSTVHTFEKRII